MSFFEEYFNPGLQQIADLTTLVNQFACQPPASGTHHSHKYGAALFFDRIHGAGIFPVPFIEIISF